MRLLAASALRWNWSTQIGAMASNVVFSTDDSAPIIGGQLFATARTNLADLMHRQPLLLGAIGIAVGAGVAASLRPTAAEAVGHASTNFQESVKEFATATAHRAAAVADGVTTAVAEEARVQGLTSEAFDQKTSEAGRKVERVVSHAAEHVRSQIN